MAENELNRVSIKVSLAVLEALKDEQYERRKQSGKEPTYAELIDEWLRIRLERGSTGATKDQTRELSESTDVQYPTHSHNLGTTTELLDALEAASTAIERAKDLMRLGGGITNEQEDPRADAFEKLQKLTEQESGNTSGSTRKHRSGKTGSDRGD